jgi:RHS repeat-associated protein
MVDSSGQTVYTYDLRDRLLQKAVNWKGGTNVSLNYAYDANGNVTSIASTTPNGVNLAYAYDPLGRLTNVLDNGNPVAGYAYDLVGNLQALRYGNGVTNQYQYDSLNRLTNLTWNSSVSTLAKFTYLLGATGTRTNLNETVGGTNRVYTWQYDNLYRLTNEAVSSIEQPYGSLIYHYDNVGNRTNRTSTISQLPTANSSYNANDWLTNTDQYDSNGNTTNSSGNSYQYDAMNHITNATVNSTQILMTYDGDGNRVSKTVGGVTTYYLVDDVNPSGYEQVLEEYCGSTLTNVYNYGLGLISQRQPSMSTNYFISDGHGSTRMLTDNGGTVVNVLVYDAYGNLIASNGVLQTGYLYSGQQFDSDLGLYYNRARYLNTGTGRFWTMDTDDGNNDDPLSLHKYLYAGDDPVNFTDPTGHARYEWDSQGFHVHSTDSQGKLTYMVRLQNDGTIVLQPKPGHESEFSLARARADYAKNVRNPGEFQKMRNVVRDAWNNYNDKDGIAQFGRNLRRSGAVIGSLYIISWGLSLDPGNADAVQRLHTAMNNINSDWQKHIPLDDGDILDAAVAVKDVYGNDDAATWYWYQLQKLQGEQNLNSTINDVLGGLGGTIGISATVDSISGE